MRVVVGDAEEPNVIPTGRPPFSRVELTLIGVTEWPFPTPHAVFQTDAMNSIFSPGTDEVSPSELQDDLNVMPIVTELTPTENSDGDDVKFDVDWTAVDPNDELETISLFLIDLVDDSIEDQTTISIGGSTESNTTTLTDEGDDGEGHTYVVRAVVEDEAANTFEAATPPIPEDGAP